MSDTSNREPRRLWKASESNRTRGPCASCGCPARARSAGLPFCDTCLDWACRGGFLDRGDLGDDD